jgi:hypothetical protein
MRVTRPLFAIDPGWLFIAAGVALCAAIVLLPAQRDLFTLRQQLAAMQQQERFGIERLRAHEAVLADLQADDPSLTRRLAAAQLNIIPASDRPVFLTAQQSIGITEWIDARVAAPHGHATGRVWPETTLSALAAGEYRLWLLAGAMTFAFIGLLVGPPRRDRDAAGQQRA